MWRPLRTALLLFAFMTVLTGVVYPLAVTGLAQALFPWQANGSLVSVGQGRTASERIGQPFNAAGSFQGRPSATTPVPYNGASSAGSNLGPSNPVLRDLFLERIEALRAANPGSRWPIPVDLVTSSASGLDPHISPAAAFYQTGRIARARGLEEDKVVALVRKHIQSRQFGLFGEPVMSVLRLNTALDALH